MFVSVLLHIYQLILIQYRLNAEFFYMFYLAVNVRVYIPSFKQDRAFAHGAMGRQIDPSWGGPIELFLVPASAPRVV